MVTLLLMWLAMLPVMMLGMMWVLLRSMMLFPVLCSYGFHQSLLFFLVLHVQLRDPVPLLFTFVCHLVSVALVPFACHVFVVLDPGCVVSC
jgi:hypothetical protein